MKTYTNKTILITGASSGIGMAMAHDLCSRGANLILAARSTEKLNELAELIRKKGERSLRFYFRFKCFWICREIALRN